MSLFGRNKPAPQSEAAQAPSADEQAIARYRYMLKTAPPETIEQAHAEAFAQLTPEQRRLALQKIAESVPPSERASVEQSGANPQALARLATRAEIRQPGAMERMFGQGGGASLGGVLLSSIAGTVIGSMIARQFFAGEGHGAGGAADAGEEAGSSDADQGMDGGDSFDGGGFE